MAYRTINDNFYNCASCGPLGLQLALQYDETTGDYRLIEKNITGYGLAIFYQNGTYYSDAIQDPNLFTDGNVDKLTAAGQTLSNDIRLSVYNTFNAMGGLNNGNIIHDTAKSANLKGVPGVINATQGSSPGVAGAVPILSSPPQQGNLFSGGLPYIKNPIVSTPNPAFSNGTLKYPIDLNIDLQDTLSISQYEYQSPNKDLFKSGSIDVKKILTEGISRGSALKDLLGQVILPIPNSAQDSNNVSWGDDNMDSLTTAAAATVIGQPFQTGVAAALSSLAGNLASAAGQSSLGTLLGNAPPAIMRAALLAQSGTDNPATYAALYSYILSKYGFEVSPENIMARSQGIVPNSNLQLLFQNVSLRNFTFSYMMTPRSKNEAKTVNMILRFFKQGMAAKKQTKTAGGPSLVLGTPNVFKLEYKTGNSPIKGLNKFKICALSGFNVNYAPTGQWAAYEEGQPSSVIMTMGFREIEPVYENDYQETTDNLDLPSIGPEDIGY